MKHKMITLVLTLCLILPACNIVWADSTSANFETLNSSTTSSQTPQVSENEVAVEVQNVQVEEQVEDETPELQFPHTVTVYFYYKNANGDLVSQKASNTFKKETDGWSKAVSYFEKQIKNNHLDVVNVGLTTYTFTGQWVGNNGEVFTSSDRISIKGNTYGQDTTINYYAQYTETQKHKIDFYAIDNVGHTSGSASNLGVIESYTHTFKTPADVPAEYEFLYWKNFDNGDIKNPGEQLTVDATTLTEDLEIVYYAVYEYQPSIRVIYHTAEGLTDTGSQRETIDIYTQAPQQMYWFFENSEEPIAEGTIIELPEKVVTTEPLEIEEQTDVYAHYYLIIWVNENGDLLEEDINVPYGSQPEYNSDEPIKEADAQYNYQFIGWDSELTTVTSDATYTAVYENSINSYTVTYLPGEYGDFEPYEFTVDYGTETPILDEIVGLEGYEFDGWDKEIAEIVTADVSYTALWKEISKEEPIVVDPDPDPVNPESQPDPVDPTLEPDPVDPVIDEPDPKPTDPVIDEPDPVDPEPTDPTPSDPDPEPTDPVIDEPDPKPIDPEPEEPVIDEPEPTEPIIDDPTPTEPDPEDESNPIVEIVQVPQIIYVPITRTIPTYVPTYITTTITAPKEEKEEIEEPILEEKEEEILSEETPTAAPTVEGSWALINLISLIATALLSILLLILALFNKIKEEKKIDNKMLIRITTIIISIIALIIFIFTENILLPMVLIDKWTIIMILILLVQIILTYKSKHEIEEKE